MKTFLINKIYLVIIWKLHWLWIVLVNVIDLFEKGNKGTNRSAGHWFVLQAVASAVPDPLVFIALCDICTVGGCL